MPMRDSVKRILRYTKLLCNTYRYYTACVSLCITFRFISFDCVMVASGEDAIAAVKADLIAFNLIFLDMVLPI